MPRIPVRVFLEDGTSWEGEFDHRPSEEEVQARIDQEQAAKRSAQAGGAPAGVEPLTTHGAPVEALSSHGVSTEARMARERLKHDVSPVLDPMKKAAGLAMEAVGVPGRMIDYYAGQALTPASGMEGTASEQAVAAFVPHGPQATMQDFANRPSVGGAANLVLDTVAGLPMIIKGTGESMGPRAQEYAEAVARPVVGLGAKMAMDPVAYGGLGVLNKLGVGGKLLHSALTAGFTAEQGSAGWNAAKKAYSIIEKEGVTPEAVEQATEVLINAGMIGVAGKGLWDAARPKKAKAPLKPGEQGEEWFDQGEDAGKYGAAEGKAGSLRRADWERREAEDLNKKAAGKFAQIRAQREAEDQMAQLSEEQRQARIEARQREEGTIPLPEAAQNGNVERALAGQSPATPGGGMTERAATRAATAAAHLVGQKAATAILGGHGFAPYVIGRAAAGAAGDLIKGGCGLRSVISKILGRTEESGLPEAQEIPPSFNGVRIHPDGTIEIAPEAAARMGFGPQRQGEAPAATETPAETRSASGLDPDVEADVKAMLESGFVKDREAAIKLAIQNQAARRGGTAAPAASAPTAPRQRTPEEIEQTRRDIEAARARMGAAAGPATAETTPAPAAEAEGAPLARFVFTKDMHQQLADLGFPPEIRAAMTPQEAQEAIDAGKRYGTPAATGSAKKGRVPPDSVSREGFESGIRQVAAENKGIRESTEGGEVAPPPRPQAASTPTPTKLLRKLRQLGWEDADIAKMDQDRMLAIYEGNERKPESIEQRQERVSAASATEDPFEAVRRLAESAESKKTETAPAAAEAGGEVERRFASTREAEKQSGLDALRKAAEEADAAARAKAAPVKWYHQDHSLAPEHVTAAEAALKNAGPGFHIVQVPVEKPLPNALYGPTAGDAAVAEAEVVRQKRGSREVEDRMVRKPMRPSKTMTVIGVNKPDGTTEIYTAHGGPPAARHPMEQGLSPEEKAESERFWSEHALATGEEAPPVRTDESGRVVAEGVAAPGAPATTAPEPPAAGQPNFQWQDIKSSAFSRVGYDPATQKLALTDAKTGKTFVYTGVTQAEFDGAMNKPADFKGDWSLGRELGHVRNRYKGTGEPLETAPATPVAAKAPLEGMVVTTEAAEKRWAGTGSTELERIIKNEGGKHSPLDVALAEKELERRIGTEPARPAAGAPPATVLPDGQRAPATNLGGKARPAGPPTPPERVGEALAASVESSKPLTAEEKAEFLANGHSQKQLDKTPPAKVRQMLADEREAPPHKPTPAEEAAQEASVEAAEPAQATLVATEAPTPTRAPRTAPEAPQEAEGGRGPISKGAYMTPEAVQERVARARSEYPDTTTRWGSKTVKVGDIVPDVGGMSRIILDDAGTVSKPFDSRLAGGAAAPSPKGEGPAPAGRNWVAELEADLRASGNKVTPDIIGKYQLPLNVRKPSEVLTYIADRQRQLDARDQGSKPQYSVEGTAPVEADRTWWEKARDSTRKAKRDVMQASKDTWRAFSDYIGSGFRDINKSLRGQEPNQKDVAAAHAIDDLLDKAGYTLTQDTVVYRGYGNRKALPAVGETFTEHGIASVTADKDFAAQRGGVVEVMLPKGTKVLVGGDHESELILPRGMKFETVSRGEDGGPWKIRAVEQGRPQYSVEPNALGFYSQLDRVVADPKTQATQRGADWLRFLSDPKRGVKTEELRWSGLDDYLKRRGAERVTRQEIQDYLKQNAVTVREVRLGEGGSKPAKFRKYQLPGAKSNYREILLKTDSRQTPEWLEAEAKADAARIAERKAAVEYARASQEIDQVPEGEIDRLAAAQERLRNAQDAHREALRVLQHAEADFYRQETSADNFTEGHWDETPNVVAHVRMSDRNDSSGRRVLYIDEIQSDWAQKGRKEGFRSPQNEKDVADIDARRTKLKERRGQINAEKEALRRSDEYVYGATGLARVIEKIDALDKEWGEITDEIDRLTALRLEKSGRHPAGPFVQDTPAWTDLVVKRILRMAAEEGYDAVDWSTSDIQLKRWQQLAQQVDQIRGRRGSPGNVIVSAFKGGRKMVEKEVPESKLASEIGEEPARRLIEKMNEAESATPKKKAPASRRPKPDGEVEIKDWTKTREQGRDADNPVLTRVPMWKTETPGMVISEISPGTYTITHEGSGLAVNGRGCGSFEFTRKSAAKLAEFGLDWTKSDVELVKSARDAGVLGRMHDIGRDMDAAPKRSRSQKIPEKTGILSGEEMMIGGKGMRDYYDGIVPDSIRRIGKKWGVQVGKAQIDGEPVHTIDISSEMRESVQKQGFPQFEVGKGPAAPAPITVEAVKRNLPSFLSDRVVKTEDGEFLIDTPNGRVTIKPTGDIQADWHALEEGHGAGAVEGVRAGAQKIVGETRHIGRDSIIKAVESGVLPHEILHVWLDHFARPSERALIEKELQAQADRNGISIEEQFANSGKEWFDRELESEPTTVLGRMYRGIHDFLLGVYQHFRPSVEGIYRNVYRGSESWNRGEGAEASPGRLQAAYRVAAKDVGDRVENFRRWFGGSKVAHEDGSPKVLYHGTKAVEGEGFSEFQLNRGEYPKPLIWASEDPGHANVYVKRRTVKDSEEYRDWQGRMREGAKWAGKETWDYEKSQPPFAGERKTTEDGGNVMSLYMSLKNPLIMDGWEVGSTASYADAKRQAGFDFPFPAGLDSYYKRSGAPLTFYVNSPEFVEAAKAHGYDGIGIRENYYGESYTGMESGKAGAYTLRDPFEGAEAMTWAAFDANQVKSATGNVGTFSPASRDIRYATAKQSRTTMESVPAGATNEARAADEQGVAVTPGAMSAPQYSTRTVGQQIESIKALNARAKWFSEEEMSHYIDALQNVTRAVLANKALQYSALKDTKPLRTQKDLENFEKVGFAALKKNSDPQYQHSLDFTTMCLKRYILSATVDKVQSTLQRPLTAEEIIDIRSHLEQRGHEVNCGACYVESRRNNLSTVINKAMQGYTDGKGVKHPPLGVDEKYLLSQEGIDQLAKDDPVKYKAFRKLFGGSQMKIPEARTEYRREITIIPPDMVKAMNRASGLRWQSWSDFEMPHLLDGMQAIGDMVQKGLKGQAYTKQLNFVRAFAQTGMMINMSLIPKGTGLDKNGRLVMKDSESFPVADGLKLRQKYDNVGFELIGVSDEHIRTALADPRIDYVIPYHASGLPRAFMEKMGMETWKDYTDEGSFKYTKRTKVGTDKSGKPVYKEIGDKFDEPPIYFNEFNGDLKKFDRLCRERNAEPPFSRMRNWKGYEKLLTDRRIYGNDGKVIVQQPVQAKFDMDAINSMLKGYRKPNYAADGVVVRDAIARGRGKKWKRVDEADKSRYELEE